jgi:AraC-like DNA-binding protein
MPKPLVTVSPMLAPMKSVELAVSVPGLRAVRSTSDSLTKGIKQYYAVGRLERGRTEWWGRGRVWRSAPGSIHVKEPGDVHRDLAYDGTITWTMVALPADEIVRVREEGKAIAVPHFDARDERAAPFHRLHDAIVTGADRLSLEVALAEAVSAFATLSSRSAERTRPVRRAIEYLRAHLADPITLDALATHAALDKFHLCRAFRAQVGMPPHAYLTHLRIQRAKELLARGTRASDLAPLVGLYDQSQLTRHFRRIVGTTPARYRSTQLAPITEGVCPLVEGYGLDAPSPVIEAPRRLLSYEKNPNVTVAARIE